MERIREKLLCFGFQLYKTIYEFKKVVIIKGQWVFMEYGIHRFSFIKDVLFMEKGIV